MPRPELHISPDVAEKYDVIVPMLGYASLAKAADLDSSHLSTLTISILGSETAAIGGHAGRCVVEKKRYADGTIERDATIEVFPDFFYPYAVNRLNLKTGSFTSAHSEQVAGMAFSGVLLHELLHLARIEKSENGVGVPYLPRLFPLGMLGIQVPIADKEERYVRYRTHQLLKKRPALLLAANITLK